MRRISPRKISQQHLISMSNDLAPAGAAPPPKRRSLGMGILSRHANDCFTNSTLYLGLYYCSMLPFNRFQYREQAAKNCMSKFDLEFFYGALKFAQSHEI